MHEVDRPVRSLIEQRSHLLDEREVAIHEADTGYDVRRRRRGREPRGRGGVDPERLLGEHVHACFERRERDFRVDVVRRAIVDDVDAVQELLERSEGTSH